MDANEESTRSEGTEGEANVGTKPQTLRSQDSKGKQVTFSGQLEGEISRAPESEESGDNDVVEVTSPEPAGAGLPENVEGQGEINHFVPPIHAGEPKSVWDFDWVLGYTKCPRRCSIFQATQDPQVDFPQG